MMMMMIAGDTAVGVTLLLFILSAFSGSTFWIVREEKGICKLFGWVVYFRIWGWFSSCLPVLVTPPYPTGFLCAGDVIDSPLSGTGSPSVAGRFDMCL